MGVSFWGQKLGSVEIVGRMDPRAAGDQCDLTRQAVEIGIVAPWERSTHRSMSSAALSLIEQELEVRHEPKESVERLVEQAQAGVSWSDLFGWLLTAFGFVTGAGAALFAWYKAVSTK